MTKQPQNLSGIQQYTFIFAYISLIRARLVGAYLHVCSQLKSASSGYIASLILARLSHICDFPGDGCVGQALSQVSHPPVRHPRHSLTMKAEDQLLDMLLLVSRLLTSFGLSEWIWLSPESTPYPQREERRIGAINAITTTVWWLNYFINEHEWKWHTQVTKIP